MSPLYACTKFPPCYIGVGTRDPLLPESLTLAKALTAADIEHDLHVIEGAPHGFFQLTPLPAYAEGYSRARAFLDRHGESGVALCGVDQLHRGPLPQHAAHQTHVRQVVFNVENRPGTRVVGANGPIVRRGRVSRSDAAAADSSTQNVLPRSMTLAIVLRPSSA